MRVRLRSLLVVSVIGLSIGAAVYAFAIERRASEADVKSSLIFNVLLFVKWETEGSEARHALRLCIVGDPATSEAMRTRVAGETIGKTRLSVVDNPEQADASVCDAVFVGGNNPSMLYRTAVSALGQPVLVMGEGPLAIENGAMIGFVLVGGRYVIDVNLAAARREHFSVSSKLLRLARRVVE